MLLYHIAFAPYLSTYGERWRCDLRALDGKSSCHVWWILAGWNLQRHDPSHPESSSMYFSRPHYHCKLMEVPLRLDENLPTSSGELEPYRKKPTDGQLHVTASKRRFKKVQNPAYIGAKIHTRAQALHKLVAWTNRHLFMQLFRMPML